ncbi:MAG: DUF4860 domain-containing protein [Lachnospiraceae bacterium]|nr:DUF4860 domain-containing protein [Lachnospiraceae bacterium]MBQ6857075.1 DUF4860 domain-containing protein [Lachnospiraceae bacterium]
MTVKTDKKSRSGAEQLFPALLFFVFLLCTVFTILIGSRVYENIRERDRLSFETDTALAYITNKVRQGDISDSVSIRESDGQQFLVFTSIFDDVAYETLIYHMDGGLYELFTLAENDLDPTAGQRIMDCDTMSFMLEETIDGTMLHITLGESRHVNLLLRSTQEGGTV